MWEAFERIAGFSIGDIYEISASSTKDNYSFDDAINTWKNSRGHIEVIRGQGIWKGITNKAGCWVEGNFANCYFSA